MTAALKTVAKPAAAPQPDMSGYDRNVRSDKFRQAMERVGEDGRADVAGYYGDDVALEHADDLTRGGSIALVVGIGACLAIVGWAVRSVYLLAKAVLS
ncbi:MAG: hypothetical protein ACRYGA_02160 [Janthinobacterium lividum]